MQTRFTKHYMSTNPFTIRTNESMLSASKLMHEKEIRHLPVLSERGQVVGILSDRDVQRAMIITKTNSNNQLCTFDPNFLVEDFMSWPVIVVSETSSLQYAAKEMLLQKVSCLLVEDMGGKLRGILTTDDVLAFFVQDGAGRDLPLKLIAKYFTSPEVY